MLAKSPYGDAYPVHVMQVAEIAAEKLRALAMRQAPRDVYDLWIIVGNNLAEASQWSACAAANCALLGLILTG